MTHAGWPFSGFFTTRPGKMDLFVLTLIDGEITHVEAIMDYDAAVTRAQALHCDRDCMVKVLPVTRRESGLTVSPRSGISALARPCSPALRRL